jgi:hypothetical protein
MKALFASAALLFATSAFATPASLTGQWSIHNNIAGNENDQECKLVQADNKITGACKTADGGEAQVSGSIDGNKATWKFDMDYNGTALTLTYTGTLDDAGKVAGSVEVQPFGVSGEFTATPVSAK